ncbi:UNVERIFIED_CONTAM: hypothetical protein QE387_001652 [Pseudacidovorax intermedius]|nr:hypothetical protein [Pseudacidovorax intermedius]
MKKLWPHLILIPLLLTIPIVSSPDFDGTLSVFRVSPFQREFIRFVLLIVFFYLNLNIFLPKLYSRKKISIFYRLHADWFWNDGLLTVLPYLGEYFYGSFLSDADGTAGNATKWKFPAPANERKASI